jgi:hypothetical protein
MNRKTPGIKRCLREESGSMRPGPKEIIARIETFFTR